MATAEDPTTTPPPSYADLSSQVTSALEELTADPTLLDPTRQAEELFRLDDKVQIFFVTADGHVSTFSEPVSLRIFKFQSEGESPSAEAAGDVFLQVGGWTHPLTPTGTSPCLLAANGALMFPDLYADRPDCSVGLVLAEEVPAEVREQLVDLLIKLTAFKKELQVEDYNLGRLGRSIVKGAELVSKGIGLGADKAGQLIEYVTEKSQVAGEEEAAAAAAKPCKVGPIARGSVRAAKTATHATVKVSGYVANRVGRLTKSLADYLAAKVDKPAVAEGQPPRKNSGVMAYVVDAARGGLIAYGTIYNNLEAAAKALGGNLKASSVTIVGQRYGTEAAEVFGDAMTAAGNGALTYMNIQSLGAKGLIKATAKQTGKNVAKNLLKAHGGEKQPLA